MRSEDTPPSLANLTREERFALFEALSKKKKVQPSAPGEALYRRERDTALFPLSFAQQRLWFLDQFEPNTPLYNIPLALRLQGRLNYAALQHALHMIIARHETLRTTFQVVDGEPRQSIAQLGPTIVPLVDLRALPSAQSAQAALHIAATEGLRPFDLSRDTMLRVMVVQIAEEEHILLLTMHHIASDGWSQGVFTSELMTFYAAYLQGTLAPLPELPVQYVDFALWQREHLQGPILDKLLGYWKRQLADLPTLQLATDQPRPAIRTIRGAFCSQVFPYALLQRLKELSRREDASVFMTLLAALAALLSRYTGSDDIPIGTSIANRNRAEVEKLIGFFVNTLVMRIRLIGQPTFRALLKQVREVCLEAYAHQDLPFERLVDELHPERDLSMTNPLVPVTLVVQNTPQSNLELPGLRLHPLELETHTSKFDLSIFITDSGHQAFLDIEYNSDLFEEATIMRLLGHFITLLEAAVADPDQHLSTLPLLTPAEYEQYVVTWNTTRATYPHEACIHQLFEQQVARTPDALAVVYKDELLQYAELNRRANQLAHALREQGVGPDVLVALCLERSCDLIVAIFAILKAGGGYLPLDPTYPVERLAFLLQDSQAPLLLTHQKLTPLFPSKTTQILCLETLLLDNTVEANPESSGSTANLAYVIYTSGSTGQPKGVMITHGGLVNYLHWASQAYDVQAVATHGALVHSSISFDLTVTSIFAPLLVGQSIMLLPDGEKEALHTALQTPGSLRLVKVTPTHLEMLQPSDEVEALTGQIGTLVIGGEALHTRPLAFWRKHAPTTRLINEYGPTETVVGCCVYEVLASEQVLDPVPIGRPIANTQIYVLDAALHPVPAGIAGEIYIGGDGVARGYLHRPHLTAERFIPDPFSLIQGARLYRTGDLARFRSDGNLEFLGRIDQQVKIRGYRIELGEIEAVLQEHPAIHRALVIARATSGQDPASGERLLAYVVRQQARPDAVQETPAEWAVQQVAHWQHIFDSSYHHAAQPQDVTFNLAGWNSSYTSQPIPAAEMREWVEYTVERIRAHHPARILEIGCGTGLLLSHLAPTCTAYWGTDFSPVVIQKLHQLVQAQQLANVTLLLRNADDFSGVLATQEGTFDAIILNSVVQYFPGVEYLVNVLVQASRLLTPGGLLFVGDVRNLTLLEAFHTSVQLRLAALSLLTPQLRMLIQKRMEQENELLLAPEFFYALQTQLPQIKHIEIQLKRGSYHNELTRFRYDVCLYKECPVHVVDDLLMLDWQAEHLTLPACQALLVEQQPAYLHVTRVPNARLATDLQALALLQSEARFDTVGAIWHALQTNAQAVGVDPEQVWQLDQQVPYDIRVIWSATSPLACYDVLFIRHALAKEQSVTSSLQPGTMHTLAHWRTYANAPFQAEHASNLIPELRSYLKQRLPDYMLPAALIELKTLPLSPNGKIDLKSLPDADGTRPELKSVFIAPSTETEKKLAEIWAQVLGIEHIGVHDNFFELGGDSLLTIRIVTKASQVGLNITVKQIFQHQTIAQLASASYATHTLAAQDMVTGPVPMMPVQRANLGIGMGDPSCHSMAYILETPEPLDPEHVQDVVRHLLAYHDALRIRARQDEQGWHLFNADMPSTLPFQRHDYSHLPEVEQVAAVMKLAEQLVLHFDLAHEPLLRVAWCYLGPHRPTPLIVVGHSLVVDMQSWQILLEDVKTAYLQRKETATIHFPPKTTAYKQWADRLTEHAQSAQIQAELPYWLSKARQQIVPLPMDYPGGVNDGASTRMLFKLFSLEETELLKREVAKRSDLQMDIILLTAVAQTFLQWSSQRSLLVTIDGYGRDPLFEDIDLSHTLGTLAMDFPLLLELDAACTPQAAQQAVQAQLRDVPNHGIGYNVLRYMGKDRDLIKQLEALPQPEVFFNYLGPLLVPEVDTFKIAGPFNGRVYTMDKIQSQPAPFMVTGFIDNGQLQMTWHCSINQYRAETVEMLANGVMAKVRTLLQQWQDTATSYLPI